VVGSVATFNCTTNNTNSIRWVYFAPSSTDDIILNNGEKMNPKFADRFRVMMTNRTSRLEVTNLQMSDAGTYVCRDSTAAKYNRSFELVTIGKLSKLFEYSNIKMNEK
jgi:Immunoglobulin V-set domain